jgi:TetR/AcrR family transcriptional regulator, fatty acid metabolism regulator protein
VSAASSRAAAAADKRRQILDAAIRVFATRGFHACRVSDVADEAGVAYGLVYHYFGSKEEILNTLFTERWQIMLDAIAEVDKQQEISARDKLYLVASFIIDSYRHEPDLMKVIIVEVTRAANSFGRDHLAKIREAYDMIGQIVENAQRDGVFKKDISADFAALMFYGAIEQLLSGWIFDVIPQSEDDFEQAKSLVVEAICGGLEVPSSQAAPVSG